MKCKRCEVMKVIEEPDRRTKDKLRYGKYCHECRKIVKREYYSKWANANKDRIRNSHLKYHYGITTEDYNRMFNSQDGKCAICNTHQSELDKVLSVDHNHTTNKVRGLLCVNCNHALGALREDSQIINGMLNYLKQYEE